MTENHFRSHFSPFQINTQLFFFFEIFYKMAAGGHFGWPKITFDRISRHFRSIRNFFFIFFFKMAAGGHFGFWFLPKSTGTSLYSMSVATFIWRPPHKRSPWIIWQPPDNYVAAARWCGGRQMMWRPPNDSRLCGGRQIIWRPPNNCPVCDDCQITVLYVAGTR